MTQRLLDILVSSFPRLVLYCVQVTIPLTVCIYILSLVLGFPAGADSNSKDPGA